MRLELSRRPDCFPASARPGYNGHCMVGTGNGTIGYSGVTGNGGATYVVPTSEGAWQACGATPRYPRGACADKGRLVSLLGSL